MSTENENRLHEIVNMQNVDIPLSLLFDLTDFAKDKIEDININIDLLKTTLDSSYIDRQSSIVKNAIQERMEFVKQYPEFVKDEKAIVDLDEQLNFLMKIEKAL